MKRRSFLTLAAALITTGAGGITLRRPSKVLADGNQFQLPETLAGRRFEQWLAAYNAADVEGLRDFHAGASPPGQASGRATLDLLSRRETGGIDPQRTLRSSEYSVLVLGISRLTELWMEGTFNLSPEPPHALADIGGKAVAPPDNSALLHPLSEDGLQSGLDRYLDKLAGADAFSGSVLIAREGRVVYLASRGLADLGTGSVNAPDTKFNLGSMNKMFTAVAVAQLVQQGRLAFDAPIGRYLAGLPADVAERVTVHHLLTHTSGLGDFFGPRFEQVKESLRTLRDYLPLFVEQPLKFDPGTGWDYSSGGFIVLGLLVEQLSGQDYFAYIRDHIYQPAGMRDSDSYLRDSATPNLATGYTLPLPPNPADLTPEVALGPRTENWSLLPLQGSSAGGGYSTVEDLLRFDRALRGNVLLNPALTEAVLQGRVPLPFDEQERYGYGFQEERYRGTRITGHGGGFPGVSSKLDIYRDLGYTVAVLANIDGGAQPVVAKVRELLVRP